MALLPIPIGGYSFSAGAGIRAIIFDTASFSIPLILLTTFFCDTGCGIFVQTGNESCALDCAVLETKDSKNDTPVAAAFQSGRALSYDFSEKLQRYFCYCLDVFFMICMHQDRKLCRIFYRSAFVNDGMPVHARCPAYSCQIADCYFELVVREGKKQFVGFNAEACIAACVAKREGRFSGFHDIT